MAVASRCRGTACGGQPHGDKRSHCLHSGTQSLELTAATTARAVYGHRRRSRKREPGGGLSSGRVATVCLDPERLKPGLVTSVHSVRQKSLLEPREGAVLRFLRQNMAPSGCLAQNPRVVGIDSERAGIPSDALLRNEFHHFRFDRDPKGLPSEASSSFEVRPCSVTKPHVGGIAVPGRPELRSNQPSPNIVYGSWYFQLIPDVNRRVRWREIVWPSDTVNSRHEVSRLSWEGPSASRLLQRDGPTWGFTQAPVRTIIP